MATTSAARDGTDSLCSFCNLCPSKHRHYDKSCDYGKSCPYCKCKSAPPSVHIKSPCDSKGSAQGGIGKRGDVYHPHFTKAVQLNDWLKTPNPIAPRPLYCPSPCKDGDAWDYVVAAGTRSESKSQDYSSAAGVISSASRDISDLSG
jgi:hypothetical protein